MSRVPPARLAGVVCVSASVLLVELGITRLFSVITWGHLAFLAVSLALFGLSASAVFIHITGRRHPAETLGRQFWAYAVAFAVSTMVVAVLFLRTPIGEAFTSGSVLDLLGVYLLTATPFIAGGACLALAVSRLHHDINRIYGADLFGAALGCVLFIPALDVFGGPGPLVGAAALGALGAVCFAEGRAQRAVAAVLAAAAVVALLVQAVHPYLDVRYTKTGQRPWVFAKWNSHSRVAVSLEPHIDWGLSSTYSGAHPRSYHMDIDASASTPILVARGPSDVAFLRDEITAFGYRLMPAGGDALIIGPGGGRDLWSALVYGARRAVGVEINSIIVTDVMRGRFRDESGNLYGRPDVEIHVDDARNFVARSRDRYDVIQASLVDTWAATAAGAFSLAENNLYTVDAFVDYFDHLKPGGVLSVSRWSVEGLRVVALGRAAGERLGWPMADRVVVVEKLSTAPGEVAVSTFLFKTTPFSAEEAARLRQAARDLAFRVVYAPHPGGAPEGDPLYVAMVAGDPTTVYTKSDTDVSPVGDERPFFFQTVKPEKLLMVLRTALFSDTPDGMFVLVRMLYVSLALVSLFIILPLVLHRGGGPREWPIARLGYFACLGVGFMLIEIGLMQRFVLFLGHPVYALTVVAFTLLLGGALGSTLSRRLASRPGRLLAVALPLIGATAVLYAYLLPYVFSAWLGFARPLRILLSVLLLLPLGVGLGLPLPAGFAAMGRRRPQDLAWAWAINGATSVLGSVLAMLIALVAGFRVVVLGGTLCYVLALVLGLRLVGDTSGDEDEARPAPRGLTDRAGESVALGAVAAEPLAPSRSQTRR